jgi:hypothetical protein
VSLCALTINLDGWNGFATVAEYYNTFNAARAKYSTPAIIASYGNPVGYQVGQQFAPGGVTKAETIILYFYA